MLAEVISIGDELTSGQRLDTNSQWLSTRLGELGVEVRFHTTVADELAANVAVFRAAIGRADIVVASGGLGPTADDLTREALSVATGRALELDAQALEYIVALFARRRRPMPESNRLQAMFPAGSRVIPNPTGSAPGIDLEAQRSGKKPCRVFALPGVPAEMKLMWAETVAPAIAAMSDSPRVIRHRRIRCFGVGESDLEAMLPDLIRRGREPQVGITVSGATITLRITAAGATADDCFAAMEPTVATIHECLGTIVYGEEDDELEDAVLRLLIEQEKTLSTAETGTGGIIADWLSSGVERNSAAAGRYSGGFIRHGSSETRENSPEAVGEFAKECRQQTGADLTLATGPFPKPRTDREAPEFHFALDSAAGVQARTTPYVGPPDILKTRAAKQVLNFLRLELLRAR
jgi:nicotinamide-nucleotide amidase